MGRIGAVNFRWNQWVIYFATDRFKRLRFWLAPKMYGFLRITDENHSSTDLVKKYECD